MARAGGGHGEQRVHEANHAHCMRSRKYQSYADEHDDNFGGEGANYARAIDPLVVNPRVAIKKTI